MSITGWLDEASSVADENECGLERVGYMELAFYGVMNAPSRADWPGLLEGLERTSRDMYLASQSSD